MKLSGERIIGADSELYHRSRTLDALIIDGSFDPSKSQHEGMMYLTFEPTTKSNCVVRVAEDLRVYGLNELSQGELDMLTELGDGNFWHGAAFLGYDGRIVNQSDAFTQRIGGGWCQEIGIFASSLSKLVNIRRV